MSIDEQHVALPKLYGAPAYARPALVVAEGPRPFDPDDLPIEAFQTDGERELAATLPARAWAPGGIVLDRHDRHDRNGQGIDQAPTGLRPRPLSLRAIAGRLIGGD